MDEERFPKKKIKKFMKSRKKAQVTGSVPGIRAFITYSEIFYQRPTPRHVELLFSHLPLENMLAFISGLALIIENNPVIAMTADMQRKLIQPFEKNSPWINRLGELLINENRVLIHQVQLGIMIRLAILHCKETKASDIINEEDFIRILLAVNELHGITHNVKRKIDKSADDFIDIETQGMLTDNSRLETLLLRTERFFQWLEKIPTTDRDYLPVTEDLIRFTGMGHKEYLAASFCVFTPFLTIKSFKDVVDQKVVKSLDQMYSTFKIRTFIDSWMAINSISLESLRLQFESAPISYRNRDLLPFLEKPIVTIDKNGDKFFCPVPAFLSNSAGTGLYFLLFNAYKAENNEKHSHFASLYGRFLEDYCREIINWASKGSYLFQSGDEIYYTPLGEGKATDIVLQNESNIAVFIEISKKRFKLIETILNGDHIALSKDLDLMIVRKAEQIAKYIRALEAGFHTLPKSATLGVPIVITGQDIPLFVGINNIIQKSIESTNIFDGIKMSVLPLTYMSIGELEDLARTFWGKLDFHDWILEKQNHPNFLARIGSVRNYFYFFRAESRLSPGENRPAFLGDENYFGRVILNTIKEWGLDETS